MELNMIHGNYNKIKLWVILKEKYNIIIIQYNKWENFIKYGLMVWMEKYHKICMTIEKNKINKTMMTIYDIILWYYLINIYN